MLYCGGVVGECICAYAFAAPYYGLNFVLGMAEITILNTFIGSSSGTLVSLRYNITEYVGGVITDSRTATLNVGDPDAVELFTNPNATYTINLVHFMDDGAVCSLIVPLSVNSGSTIASISWKEPVMDLVCRNLDVWLAFGVSPQYYTTNPAWFDGNLNQIGSGVAFMGEVPEPVVLDGFPLNMGFSAGIDLSEWSDLPATGEPYKFAAVGFLWGDCLS